LGVAAAAALSLLWHSGHTACPASSAVIMRCRHVLQRCLGSSRIARPDATHTCASTVTHTWCGCAHRARCVACGSPHV
jgi:hypothetical protein